MNSRGAVFQGHPKPFEIRAFPVPDPKPGAIIVKICLCNVCGSDLHHWRGDVGSSFPPGGRIVGHEMVGEVFRLGEGVTTDSLSQPLKEGDRIVYTYFYPCGRCKYCTSGRFSLCTKRAVHYQESADTWPHLNGGFADYYYLRPGHFAYKVPDELSDEMVASANCALSQVIYGLQRAGLSFGDSLVVQGSGGLGLYAIAVAREMGAQQIIVIDAVPFRLELAREFGADEVVSLEEYPTPEARVNQVKKLTGGWGSSVVLEVAGVPQVIPEGLQMVEPGGTYVDVGAISNIARIELLPSSLVRSNLRYIGVMQYEPIALAQALEFLQRTRNRYPFHKMVSHKFPLEKINEAFEQSDWFGRHPQDVAVTRTAIVP